MNTTNKLALIAALLVTGLSSCKKEFDEPPVHTLEAGNVITMDSLVNMYQGTDVHFTSNLNVYGVVTADEVDGNFYKNVYVQSGNAAINLRLLNSGGLYIGDSVRIHLPGTILTKYNGMLQLDSVDVDVNVIKQSTNVTVNPTVVTISSLNTSMAGRLVKLNNVEFDALELSNTWADAVNQTSQDRTLTDCSGNTVIVRTSGYALYAGNLLPQGNGSLTAIVGVYGSTIQLYLRSLGETSTMTGTRCTGMPPLLFKDFNDNSITSGGWTNQNVVGAFPWTTYSVSGDYVGKVTGYTGTNNNSETWLISPSVNLSSTTAPVLSFRNVWQYSGPALKVYVSTDYVSGAPSTGTWTELTGLTLSGGASWGDWVTTTANLSAFLSGNVHIGFKYTGTTTGCSTWEVDEISIAE
ncbi:MAG TPA: DUF5689 domain-containing protein [Flavobacteriales bacterium]|nr:DUF5689 domain-containing protein [Flavobacteriales bacterium]